MTHITKDAPRPVVKWVGGKGALLDRLAAYLPKFVHTQPFCWIEPFFGGGAFFWWARQHLTHMRRCIINDTNADLINLYTCIKDDPAALYQQIALLQQGYDRCITLADKKPFYYDKRALFNTRACDRFVQAALFLFLNKAGFNGLYRVNKQNAFNVPIGSYTRPIIADKMHLLRLSDALQDATIICGDYQNTLDYIPSMPTFFYFDPPYRPISDTAKFTSYTKDGFDDDNQIQLAAFCQKISAKGHAFLQSNADTKDGFFEELYASSHLSYIQAPRTVRARCTHRR